MEKVTPGMKNKRAGNPSIDSYIPSSRALRIEEFSVRLTPIHRSSVSFFPPSVVFYFPIAVYRVKLRGAIALQRIISIAVPVAGENFIRVVTYQRTLQFVLTFLDIS